VWTGEFGRTPTINGNKLPGRDHWPFVYSSVLAGGGVRGGQVYGSSDSIAARPKDNPVHVSDFVATIYHALGYDATTKVVGLFSCHHWFARSIHCRASSVWPSRWCAIASTGQFMTNAGQFGPCSMDAVALPMACSNCSARYCAKLRTILHLKYARTPMAAAYSISNSGHFIW
jgi:Protein of unknown function (DUF1501)